MKNKTLTDVVDQLKDVSDTGSDTSKSVEELQNSVSSFFKMIKTEWDRKKISDNETRRESKRPQNPTKSESISTIDAFKAGLSAGSGYGLITLLNPKNIALLAGKLVGVGLVGGSVYLGFNGLAKSVAEGVVKGVYKLLGLTVKGFIPAEKGVISTIPVLEKITRAFSVLEISILKSFGLNPKGVPLRNALGQFTGEFSRVSVVERLTATIGKILSPLRGLWNGIDKWIIGPGAKLMGFISGVLGINKGIVVLSKFSKFLGKLFWPITILSGLYNAIVAFVKDYKVDGSLPGAFVAGIGGFLGDIVGAPLDLLENISIWLIKKVTGYKIEGIGFEDIMKSFSAQPMKYLTRLSDWVGEQFELLISWFDQSIVGLELVLDDMKISFKKFTTILKNIPDKIIAFITRMLDFELPKIGLSTRFGDISLFDGGSIFTGMNKANLAAEQRIQNREQTLESEIKRIKREQAEKLSSLISRQQSQGNQTLVVAPDNRASTVNQTGINMNMIASPVDNFSSIR